MLVHLGGRRESWVVGVVASLLLGCGSDDVVEPEIALEVAAEIDVTFNTETLDLLEPETEVTANIEVVAEVDGTEEIGAECGAEPYDFFCPCTRNSQCGSGWCVPVDEDAVAMRCSRTCQDQCEQGWECRGVATGGDPLFLCQPPIDALCDACEKDADCKELGATCITYGIRLLGSPRGSSPSWPLSCAPIGLKYRSSTQVQRRSAAHRSRRISSMNSFVRP